MLAVCPPSHALLRALTSSQLLPVPYCCPLDHPSERLPYLGFATGAVAARERGAAPTAREEALAGWASQAREKLRCRLQTALVGQAAQALGGVGGVARCVHASEEALTSGARRQSFGMYTSHGL